MMKKIKLLTGTGHSGLFGAVMAFMAMIVGFSSCRPDFDLDKQFPSFLGTSIYETLDEGFDGHSFKRFVAIIDSLNYRNVLEKTGSKTLFVADDEAFDRFLDKCPLAGNRKIKFEDLTQSQMKQIFYGSMLNNVYQVAALSNTEGPTIGDCMRRVTSSGIYDSLRVMMPDEMPSTPYWKNVKEDPAHSSGIVILEDGTKKPMIIFSDKFLERKGVSRTDYDFLFNLSGNDKSKAGDASVNGVRIKEGNKKCFNGFIHVMEDVVYLLPSMAEYLAMSDPNDDPSVTSIIYDSILERFSGAYEVRSMSGNRTYPVAGLTTSETHLKNINDQFERKTIRPNSSLKTALSKDAKVYTKLFLSKRNQGSDAIILSATGDTLKQSAVLKFDPGWNSYFVPSISDDAIALQQNMGVMIVPTDDAMMDWWLNKGGKEMREKYGLAKYRKNPPTTPQQVAEDMDSVDMNVIVKLINNTMLTSLVSSVPSKFGSVLNDAQDPLWEGIAKPEETITRVAMCCNGAIYFSNYIPTPTSYRSVAYPALVDERLKVMDWAIEDEEMSFIYYLNAMSINYSVFLPQSATADPRFEDKVVWIDPASFAIKKKGAVDSDGKKLKAIAFGFNNESQKVEADIYDYDEETDTYGDKLNTQPVTNGNFLRNRLEDMLNNHIVVTTKVGKKGVESNDLVDQNKYSFYRTKGGGVIRFKTGGFDPKTDFGKMEVAGGWQVETGRKVNITDRYDMDDRSFGNGITYIIDTPLMTSRNSVYDILSDSVNYPKFKLFFELMKEAKLFSSTSNGTEIGSTNCVNFFSTFNYTVYVPSSESIQALFDDSTLYSPAFLNSFYNSCESAHDSIFEQYGVDREAGDSAWTVYRIALSRELRKADVTEADTHADSVFDYNEFIAKQRDIITNFVKYHIQDNSVFINAEFNRDSTDYQTAYMRASDKRYVKLTVRGDNDNLSIYDALYDRDDPGKHKVRHVVTTDEKYYNIMCREYEFKEGFGSDAKATGSVSDVTKTKIETSSYAVIHLIDAPLYNGEF